MLEALFGSVNRERVLLFLYARKEGYSREISKLFRTDLSQIQNQLERLEIGDVLCSRSMGKTRLYELNPRYPFRAQLEALLDKVLSFYPSEERERLTMIRRRPRRKGKPL
ncbi:MAG: DNA-binding protein [Latescibacteria bacterium DG_63]|nr:MAG: DNA-binding protein [Latescibacteria bacterium DG_63]